MTRVGEGVGGFLDKVLDRNAPGVRGLLLVVAAALVGAWLVVLGAMHWQGAQRADERAKLLQQTVDTLQARITGGGMLGAVSLLGLSEPLLKAMALGQLAPDDPEALARLGVARGRFLVNGVYVMAADGTVVAHETPGGRSTGINLAFRPYFQQAIKGAISVHVSWLRAAGEVKTRSGTSALHAIKAPIRAATARPLPSPRWNGSAGGPPSLPWSSMAGTCRRPDTLRRWTPSSPNLRATARRR